MKIDEIEKIVKNNNSSCRVIVEKPFKWQDKNIICGFSFQPNDYSQSVTSTDIYDLDTKEDILKYILDGENECKKYMENKKD